APSIHRASFASVKQLIQKIDQFVAHYNQNCKPFIWTATADSIIAKLERLCQRISGTAHSCAVPLISCISFALDQRLNENLRINTSTGWKTCEIGARQGANRNEVRPRTAEQGPRLWGCDPRAGCKRTVNQRVLTRTYAVASPEGALQGGAGSIAYPAKRARAGDHAPW